MSRRVNSHGMAYRIETESGTVLRDGLPLKRDADRVAGLLMTRHRRVLHKVRYCPSDPSSAELVEIVRPGYTPPAD